jgi:hypothetical protein
LHFNDVFRKNGYSAVNYQLRDEESTGGMGFWELPAHTRNSPEEGNSAGNYQLIYDDSDRYDQIVWEILRTVTSPGSAAPNPLYNQCHL